MIGRLPLREIGRPRPTSPKKHAACVEAVRPIEGPANCLERSLKTLKGRQPPVCQPPLVNRRSSVNRLTG